MSELNPEWMDNTETWLTRDKRQLKISEMDRDHLESTIAYMRRQKARLVLGRKLAIDRAFDYGDDMSDGVFAAHSHAISAVEHPDWLENLPVMKALKDALQVYIDRDNAYSQRGFLQ